MGSRATSNAMANMLRFFVDGSSLKPSDFNFSAASAEDSPPNALILNSGIMLIVLSRLNAMILFC